MATKGKTPSGLGPDALKALAATALSPAARNALKEQDAKAAGAQSESSPPADTTEPSSDLQDQDAAAPAAVTSDSAAPTSDSAAPTTDGVPTYADRARENLPQRMFTASFRCNKFLQEKIGCGDQVPYMSVEDAKLAGRNLTFVPIGTELSKFYAITLDNRFSTPAAVFANSPQLNLTRLAESSEKMFIYLRHTAKTVVIFEGLNEKQFDDAATTRLHVIKETLTATNVESTHFELDPEETTMLLQHPDFAKKDLPSGAVPTRNTFSALHVPTVKMTLGDFMRLPEAFRKECLSMEEWRITEDISGGYVSTRFGINAEARYKLAHHIRDVNGVHTLVHGFGILIKTDNFDTIDRAFMQKFVAEGGDTFSSAVLCKDRVKMLNMAPGKSKFVMYPAREHRPRAEKPRLPRLIVKPANEKGSILSAAKLSKLLAEYGAKAITKYNSDLTVIEVPLDCKLVTGAAHFLPEYRCIVSPLDLTSDAVPLDEATQKDANTLTVTVECAMGFDALFATALST